MEQGLVQGVILIILIELIDDACSSVMILMTSLNDSLSYDFNQFSINAKIHNSQAEVVYYSHSSTCKMDMLCYI